MIIFVNILLYLFISLFTCLLVHLVIFIYIYFWRYNIRSKKLQLQDNSIYTDTHNSFQVKPTFPSFMISMYVSQSWTKSFCLLCKLLFLIQSDSSFIHILSDRASRLFQHNKSPGLTKSKVKTCSLLRDVSINHLWQTFYYFFPEVLDVA